MNNISKIELNCNTIKYNNIERENKHKNINENKYKNCLYNELKRIKKYKKFNYSNHKINC